MVLMAEHGGNIHRYSRTMVDFSANLNPIGVPESFKQALRERTDAFAVYPDPAYRSVKRQVAAYLGVRPEWVVVGSGAVDLIYQAIQTAAKTRVYGLSPTFSEYRRAASLHKLDYCEMPVFQSGYAALEIERLLNLVRPNSAVVLCNPNNPTGTLASRQELARVAERLAAQNCCLIIDEAFIEFTDAGAAETMLAVAEDYRELLVIRAATKFFGMPGLRLGYGITANHAWRERMQAVAQPWSVNTAAVIAAEVIFDDGEYLARTKSWLREEKPYLYQRLTGFSDLQVYPSQANFYLVKSLRADLDAYRLQERLLKQKILIRTPQGFSGLTPYHFRVAVKGRDDNDCLLQALQEILA
jgi:threonine-phosphate decarboxylase